uniref:Neur_chan_LBD domain-containing protein n=1 Tax=Heterorhabditis bacteriophora TaxID=37862 RepID=A0A1I7XCS5_HETBA
MRLRDPIGSRLQANVGLSSSWDTVLPDYYSYNG